MKGVVLAGGYGTRLFPLTWATNKHLLPVYNQPMVFYPIQTLLNAGIKEIMVISSGDKAGHFIGVLRNGKELGVSHLEYGYQEDGKGGISQALAIAENFVGGDSVTVILGDNTTDADISPAVKGFKDGATVFLKKVPDPERFGVPVFSQDGKTILNIEEKPKKPKSKFAVTGVYIYDNKVFDYIRTLNPSTRGELEITDVNNIYIKKGKLKWEELNGFWCDAGSFDTLYKANKYWAEKNGVKI